MHPKLRELNSIDPHLSLDGSSNVIRDAAGFVQIRPQSGNPDEVGVNGTSIENVLALLLEKLLTWQSGPYHNHFTHLAAECIYQAIVQMDNRGRERWGGEDRSFPGIRLPTVANFGSFLRLIHGKNRGPDARKRISWDFDGVFHSYESGFTRADEVLDGPVYEVFHAAARLIDAGYEHHILSSRSNQFGGIQAMREFIERNWVHTGRDWAEDGKHFHFPLWKVYSAPVHVDDRVLLYEGPPTVAEVLETAGGPVHDRVQELVSRIMRFAPWRREKAPLFEVPDAEGVTTRSFRTKPEADAFIEGIEYVNDGALRVMRVYFHQGTWLVQLRDDDVTLGGES